MSCTALLSLSLVHQFDNLALKSQTRIEHAGCWLLILRSTSMRFSQKGWNCSWFWFGDLYRHVKKHLSLFTVISVRKHSFNLQISTFLISGKYSLSYMETSPLFVLLRWSALIIEYPLIYSLSSLSGIVESKNVSVKEMMSMLFALINASIKVNLTKSWAAIPLRLQW